MALRPPKTRQISGGAGGGASLCPVQGVTPPSRGGNCASERDAMPRSRRGHGAADPAPSRPWSCGAGAVNAAELPRPRSQRRQGFCGPSARLLAFGLAVRNFSE
uniref:Uncharacterized protein n=1 Tax=Aegilops tauschii TaxID=37682 RepID=M8BSK3_AEGTA